MNGSEYILEAKVNKSLHARYFFPHNREGINKAMEAAEIIVRKGYKAELYSTKQLDAVWVSN